MKITSNPYAIKFNSMLMTQKVTPNIVSGRRKIALNDRFLCMGPLIITCLRSLLKCLKCLEI